jgi:hypothetical protein
VHLTLSQYAIVVIAMALSLPLITLATWLRSKPVNAGLHFYVLAAIESGNYGWLADNPIIKPTVDQLYQRGFVLREQRLGETSTRLRLSREGKRYLRALKRA